MVPEDQNMEAGCVGEARVEHRRRIGECTTSPETATSTGRGSWAAARDEHSGHEIGTATSLPR